MKPSNACLLVLHVLRKGLRIIHVTCSRGTHIGSSPRRVFNLGGPGPAEYKIIRAEDDLVGVLLVGAARRLLTVAGVASCRCPVPTLRQHRL